MRRMRIKIAIILVIALFGGWLLRQLLPDPGVDEIAVLEELAPGVEFGPKGGEPIHYAALDGTLAFNSHDIVASIRGYAGPIETLVVMGPTGVIKSS